MRGILILAALTAALVSAAPATAQNLAVVSVSPAANGFAPRSTAISVEFDRPLNPATVTPANFWAFGRWSGMAEGVLVLSNGDKTVTLTPTDPLSASEIVTVYLSRELRGADGVALRAGGYSFQFNVSTAPAAKDWRLIQTLTTRTTPSVGTRAYGGVASDLDGDGWLDMTIVHEDSADLRVFMSRDDGTGTYHPFLQPTFAVNDRASPNETGDFDRDGDPDIVVANINTHTLSILLGNGDGTYGPQQQIPVGQTPRGVAVLDVDGDGDQDIVNTNYAGNNLSILLNNGQGVFGAPTSFEGGGSGEWPIVAADMTGDGLLDLVVGLRNIQRIVVARNNGNGTFTPLTSQPVGGGTWVIAAGDLDGDGDADVVSANATNNNGGVILGDGLGGLAPAVTYPADPFALSTRLGDFDGDGDLDWNLSSFNGDWRLYENNGSGVFTFDIEIPSPTAASCAVVLDFDNDGDADLALIDEIEDLVLLYENTCFADCNASGALTVADFGCFQGKYVLGDLYADCNASGTLTVADFGCFQGAYVLGCP
ncbi:MAG: FG-GAP-like repeat-containing protein [Phycisphaerales bacterium]